MSDITLEELKKLSESGKLEVHVEEDEAGFVASVTWKAEGLRVSPDRCLAECLAQCNMHPLICLAWCLLKCGGAESED